MGIKNLTGKIEEIEVFLYDKKEKGILTGEKGERYLFTINGTKLATFKKAVYEFFSEGEEVDVQYTTKKVGDREYNNITTMAISTTTPEISQQNLDKIAATVAATKKKRTYKVTVEEIEEE